ncbi:MAG: site-specific integrase [Clostridia bacterium]|nr:site-specific integrase [Clostridia bacterium]
MASYEKRGAKWCVRFRAGGENKRLSGFATKKAAEAAYIEYINRKETEPERPARMKVSELTDKFFAYREGTVKRSTQVSARQLIDMLLEKLGDYVVEDISEDVLRELDRKLMKRYTDATRAQIIAKLKTMCRYGRKAYGLHVDAVLDYKVLRSQQIKEDLVVWTPEQYAVFSAAVPVKYKAVFDLLYATGMRVGEALALTWNDIRGNSIRINKTMSRAPGAFVIGPPKTMSSNRTISVDPRIIAEIHAARVPGSRFVFPGPGKDYPLAYYTLQGAWRQVTAKLDLPKITIHGLRHSHASWLISNGVPIPAVSKRLGHANVAMTLNVYSHLLPQDDEMITRLVSKISF